MIARVKSLNLYGSIFAVYIGAGPIYWIPWIEIRFVEAIKLSLYLLVVIWPLLYKVKLSRFYFPGGRGVFWLMLAYLALSIPGMLQGEIADSLYRLQNTIQIITLVFVCGFLIKNGMIESVTHRAVKIFAFFSILSLGLMLLIPDYISPLNDELTLIQTGLGGSRTGWSPAIALYLPWLYSGLVFSGFWVWLCSLSMIANQVLVAGRTGMIAALIPYMIFGFTRKSYKMTFAAVGILTIIFLFVINNLQLLRLDEGGFGSRQALSVLSTGRTDQHLFAFESIIKSPITGSGFGQVKFGEDLIHNVILRFAAEGGVPYALSIICLFSIALDRGWRGVLAKDKFVTSAFLTVLSGVVASLFEPVEMFGSFYSAGIWWLCFAICVGYKRPSVKVKEFISTKFHSDSGLRESDGV